MINRRELGIGLGLAAVASGVEAARPSGRPTGAPLPGQWSAAATLRRPGGSLHYATIGEARGGAAPVILLHKLGGWLSDWRHVAPLLAQGRQVIAFDMPGHGGSRWDGAPPYIFTLGEIAALLVGAFDEMGFDRVHLIGTSLGGCVGVSLAAFWPERIASLAVVSSALGGRKTLEQIRQIVDLGQTRLFDRNGNPLPTTPDMLRGTFGIVNAEAINAEGNLSRRAAGKFIQPCERGVGITDVAGTLKRIEARTLLVYGEFDNAYHKFRPMAEAALRDGRTAVVKNAGAFVMQDNPAETGAVLNGFLAGG